MDFCSEAKLLLDGHHFTFEQANRRTFEATFTSILYINYEQKGRATEAHLKEEEECMYNNIE